MKGNLDLQEDFLFSKRKYTKTSQAIRISFPSSKIQSNKLQENINNYPKQSQIKEVGNVLPCGDTLNISKYKQK